MKRLERCEQCDNDGTRCKKCLRRRLEVRFWDYVVECLQTVRPATKKPATKRKP